MVLVRGPAGIGRRGRRGGGGGRRTSCRSAHHSAAELKLLARLGVAVPVVPVDAIDELDWTAADGPLLVWGGPGEHAAAPIRSSCLLRHMPNGRALAGGLAAVYAGRGSRAAVRAELKQLARELAARFAFTEGDVAAVLERVQLDTAWTGRSVDRDLVWSAARRQPEHALERLASLVTPAFSLDDLVLTDEAHAKLRELLAHVALQHVVLDDWGFRRRLPRGQGVAALFAGPSGTGKTTAAEALAGELGQDLYRIDLSAVVSKYIGETEKNLSAAFDEAERGSAVLFFDEADSLFGKRTEIRDAHDRYANLEVSYLLQRVETFTGLVILASNRQAALDEAFLRRLRFVIRFELPDADLRRRLWRRSFPDGAELAELDWGARGGRARRRQHPVGGARGGLLAAADGGTITRVTSTARSCESTKLGRRGPEDGGPVNGRPLRLRVESSGPDPFLLRAAIAARLAGRVFPSRAEDEVAVQVARACVDGSGRRTCRGADQGILASFDNPSGRRADDRPLPKPDGGHAGLPERGRGAGPLVVLRDERLGAHRATARARGLQVKLELDATDGLEKEAADDGVRDLAADRRDRDADAARRVVAPRRPRGALTGACSAAAGGDPGGQAAARPLHLGPDPPHPVRLKSLTIHETAFDELLNPIHASADLGSRSCVRPISAPTTRSRRPRRPLPGSREVKACCRCPSSWRPGEMAAPDPPHATPTARDPRRRPDGSVRVLGAPRAVPAPPTRGSYTVRAGTGSICSRRSQPGTRPAGGCSPTRTRSPTRRASSGRARPSTCRMPDTRLKIVIGGATVADEDLQQFVDVQVESRRRRPTPSRLRPHRPGSDGEWKSLLDRW